MTGAETARGTDDRRAGRWNAVREEAETLAGALPSLLVDAERVAATVAQGVHGRRRVGTGETFWQYRRYAAGDPSSRVDWRRSARTQNLYVRENEWEAAQSVWLWRDGSPSMRFGSGPVVKLHRAGVLALALGVLLVQGGERIAALGEAWPPQSGRVPLRRLAHLYGETATTSEASLPAARPMPRFAHTVWISDFLMPADDWTQRLRAFADQGVTGHLLQVLDPAEVDFPYAGRVRFEALEAGGHLLFGRAEAVKGAYQQRLAAHQAELGHAARRLGWTFSVHRTDQPPQLALLALYETLSVNRKL